MLDNQVSIAQKLEMTPMDWMDKLCLMERLSLTEINELIGHLLALQSSKARDIEAAAAKQLNNQNP